MSAPSPMILSRPYMLELAKGAEGRAFLEESLTRGEAMRAERIAAHEKDLAEFDVLLERMRSVLAEVQA